MKLFGINAVDSAEFSFFTIDTCYFGKRGGRRLRSAENVDNDAVVLYSYRNRSRVFVGTRIRIHGHASRKTKSWIAFAVYLVIPLIVSLIVL